MKLPKFDQLGTTHRIDPCSEYPGTYYVYVSGKEQASFRDTPENESARDSALKEARNLAERSEDETVSVSWSCDDSDPRQGQVWFTGYYQLVKL